MAHETVKELEMFQKYHIAADAGNGRGFRTICLVAPTILPEEAELYKLLAICVQRFRAAGEYLVIFVPSNSDSS